MCRIGRHIVTFEQVLKTNAKYGPWVGDEEGSFMSSMRPFFRDIHLTGTTHMFMVMCSWSYRKDHKYLIFFHQFAGLSPGLVIEKSHIGAVVTDCNRQ